ncbi:hypothetical protein DASC09_020020 [Saccharomycopsis crataegensis]|uniref:COX assembly mitochondrial protein n=1 Tax=Saccharomycopsis crataegensis TaxID=43959 RepID=A0AAV5QIQ2_9ASCO|nr:hypothetical protein DASC09_020020 [Saccharomycopsis crataegensis]
MGIFSFFGTSEKKDISSSGVLEDLSEEQKTFFLKENDRLEIEVKQAEAQSGDSNNGTIGKGLQKLLGENHIPTSAKEKEEFEQYQLQNTKRHAMLENCAEVQQLLLSCLKNGSYTEKFTMCNERTKAMFNCIDSQKKSLSLLGYESARSVKESEFIKGKADDLFVKHFGKEGLSLEDEIKEQFVDDLENTRVMLWK